MDADLFGSKKKPSVQKKPLSNEGSKNGSTTTKPEGAGNLVFFMQFFSLIINITLAPPFEVSINFVTCLSPFAQMIPLQEGRSQTINLRLLQTRKQASLVSWSC